MTTIKAKVLVIDDSSSVRLFLHNLLSSMNLDVETATDGQEGLEKLAQSSFDLVITDLLMPIMDGVTFCQKLHANKETRQIPVIVMSAFDSEQEIDQSFAAGATCYVAKREVQKRIPELIEKLLTQIQQRNQWLIMVVDDSLAIRTHLQQGLEHEGYRVITMKNAQEALDYLELDQPDLIISDIHMPGISGYTFCQEVYNRYKSNKIPFVAMSVQGDRGAIQRMLQHGATTYIAKPFNLLQLTSLVNKLLSDQFQQLFHEKERLAKEQNLLLSSISSLVTALEARDTYTRGHSDSVSMIVRGMAKTMNMDLVDMEQITTAALLHDIGKIGIPDHILLKPDKLTDDEYETIKQHPRMGAIILKPIPSLEKITEVALYHHERMDGKGYPHGLQGQDIPLWARITSVADTYDALTSDRPYRKGMHDEKAFQILKEGKGTQLCPDCVDLFFQWKHKESKKRL
ncbi:response regulator [Magnetococcales bacterium HHB-1]